MAYETTHSPEHFHALITEESPVLVYFFSDGCPPCKSLSPRIGELMNRFPHLIWTKIDPAVFPQIAAQNMVFTVPIVTVFLRGKEIYKSSRFVDLEKIEMILTASEE
jgi:thioredoxin-like negative regulator of GroEL